MPRPGGPSGRTGPDDTGIVAIAVARHPDGRFAPSQPKARRAPSKRQTVRSPPSKTTVLGSPLHASLFGARASDGQQRVQLESPSLRALFGALRCGPRSCICVRWPPTSATRVALVAGPLHACNSSRPRRGPASCSPIWGPFMHPCLGPVRPMAGNECNSSRPRRGPPFMQPCLWRPATSATRAVVMHPCLGPVRSTAGNECNSSRPRRGPPSCSPVWGGRQRVHLAPFMHPCLGPVRSTAGNECNSSRPRCGPPSCRRALRAPFMYPCLGPVRPAAGNECNSTCGPVRASLFGSGGWQGVRLLAGQPSPHRCRSRRAVEEATLKGKTCSEEHGRWREVRKSC